MRIKHTTKKEEFQKINAPIEEKIDVEKEIKQQQKYLNPTDSGLFLKGDFKSPNYVHNKRGWKIDNLGNAYFKSIIAGSYVQAFVQTTPPTSLHINDIWYDSDDDNHPYRAESVGADQITAGEWVSVRDAGAGATQTTIFYESTEPASGMITGDYWIDSDDNKIYRYDGANWGEVQDNQIATAIGDAATAQATADGKVYVYKQTTEPASGMGTGDIWFDTDDNNKPYRYSGSAWEAIDRPTEWADVLDGATTKPSNNADQTSANAQALSWMTSGESTEEMTFKNINVGGTSKQYSLGDDGIFSFGDGSDGAHTTTGDETLTSDKYYTNLTIATGHTLNTGGYRIFVNGTLTLEGTGKIVRNGPNGSAGTENCSSGGTGGAGGSLSAGYLPAVSGGKGGDGVASPNGCGAAAESTDISNSIGSNAGAGGQGAAGCSVGSANATASNVKLIANWHLQTLLDISSTGACVKFNGSPGGGGGASGKGGPNGTNEGGGGGGGGGCSGGIIAIYAKKIIIGASATIEANGGNGGAGGNTLGCQAGAGSGGGGGNGGEIILIYNELTNDGTITVSAGSGGSGGSKGGSGGTDGAPGYSGSAGTIRYFKLSL